MGKRFEEVRWGITRQRQVMNGQNRLSIITKIMSLEKYISQRNVDGNEEKLNFSDV